MTPSLKGNKKNFYSESKIYAYQIPGLNELIKVERVCHDQYVANYPGSPERVRLKDMKEERWVCKGLWKAEYAMETA